MIPGNTTSRPEQEASFLSHDNACLFYRIWAPTVTDNHHSPRVIVFLHRGHEHSARMRPLVATLCRPRDWGFAYDARGHGHSPGERGGAPGVACLIADLDSFVRHICTTHQLDMNEVLVVANSVSAVIAATWLHDYAPRIRGLIMAASAFRIKLYVPFAKAALRIGCRLKPDLSVTSYIRPSMLTHATEQAIAYQADTLIARTIQAKILLELDDTAARVINTASSIDTPVLMLIAGKDYVVKEKPQQIFYNNLSSRIKHYVRLPDAYHAVFYERDTTAVIEASRNFIETCFDSTAPSASRYLDADTNSASAKAYRALSNSDRDRPWAKKWFSLARLLIKGIAPWSHGMQIGMRYGFDSGASLDYIYRNQASGRFLLGKAIDRLYLDAVGWRGIRLRRIQLQQALEQAILNCKQDNKIHILDIASGSGRYVLETVKRFQHKNIFITLCDTQQINLNQARILALKLNLNTNIKYQLRDAFDPASYHGEEEKYHIAIASGIYELFSDNRCVLSSLKGIRSSLRPDGTFIYTSQPWHPQLNIIAKTLVNHRGIPWVMRARPQGEIDALVKLAGCSKTISHIGLNGIFNVSEAKPCARSDTTG